LPDDWIQKAQAERDRQKAAMTLHGVMKGAVELAGVVGVTTIIVELAGVVGVTTIIVELAGVVGVTTIIVELAGVVAATTIIDSRTRCGPYEVIRREKTISHTTSHTKPQDTEHRTPYHTEHRAPHHNEQNIQCHNTPHNENWLWRHAAYSDHGLHDRT
jgi:hypothetical protein